MKDSFDVTADIISLINVPEITGAIAGNIYADGKPSGSKIGDIVVNCLGVTNGQTQRGSANVNIYVPNLSSGRPDKMKLRDLCKLITPHLDTQYRMSFSVFVSDAGQVFQDTDGTHFVNIKLKYNSIQTNFKNL